MAIKDWYKVTFLIESDSEEIIIWKLNKLGIFSFSFEYLLKNKNKKELSELVAQLLVKKAKDLNITKIYFDRGIYKYHGRVKVFAETVRNHGMEF